MDVLVYRVQYSRRGGTSHYLAATFLSPSPSAFSPAGRLRDRVLAVGERLDRDTRVGKHRLDAQLSIQGLDVLAERREAEIGLVLSSPASYGELVGMATVGAKYQVVIEQAAREKLGIQPGWIAVQTVVGDHLEVRFLPPEHDRSRAVFTLTRVVR